MKHFIVTKVGCGQNVDHSEQIMLFKEQPNQKDGSVQVGVFSFFLNEMHKYVHYTVDRVWRGRANNGDRLNVELP